MSFVINCRRCRRFSNAPTERSGLDLGDRGWALVTVLWTLTMLALMAAAAGELTVTSYRAEQHALVDARARTLLDAAIVRAVLGIADTRPARRWRVDGVAQTIAFGDQTIHVAVQDELGRIDLNAADMSMIRQLLTGAGVTPDDADVLADRILDWRSATGLHSLKGGSDADYRSAGLSYDPRHGPFQTVDELRLVRGMTTALFAKIRPALTVYSKRAMFDPALAPREALAALYPGDAPKVDQILRLRLGDRQATMEVGLPPGVLNTAIPLGGRTFAIAADLEIGPRKFRRDAVVELTGADKNPFFVLAWR